ncbi:unnamed protein product [Amoebophrya sp. A120]|nr:unnamed protein product [Amoebophrya sp. A120]|eukprot:GSA120T00000531001.1
MQAVCQGRAGALSLLGRPAPGCYLARAAPSVAQQLRAPVDAGGFSPR